MGRVKNNKIIIALLIVVCFMSVGYAAFATSISVKGTANITGKWDVKITGVTTGTITGNGENAATPSFTNSTATVSANLYEKGDAVEYAVTVKNNGTIAATLNDITTTDSNNPAIKFTTSGVTKGSKLAAGGTATVKVKVEYNPSFTGTLTSNAGSLTLILNYVQA